MFVWILVVLLVGNVVILVFRLLMLRFGLMLSLVKVVVCFLKMFFRKVLM